MQRTVYSVSELNGLIKSLIENQTEFLNICIAGELSNYKVYPSGHHYFTLKDAESALSCVMFRSSAASLRFRPENGMSVIAAGRITVYPRDGKYQLQCSMMYQAGVGDLQIAFEKLKAKLEQEGLFDERYKKPLPEFPNKIAIVTSSAGAAVHDMIRILGERWPLAEIVVVPVRVQGEEAPGEISEAIEFINTHNLADLIITGRGGGSREDLQAFNEEIVARAIFASEIPVISAVGHEPDVAISDYVADVRASTPSNAAEIAVHDRQEIKKILKKLKEAMYSDVAAKISLSRQRVNYYAGQSAFKDPRYFFNQRRMELDSYQECLNNDIALKLKDAKSRFALLAGKMDALSPFKVLARGYSITTNSDNKIISSIEHVNKGDTVNIRLYDGRVKCAVEEIGELTDGR